LLLHRLVGGRKEERKRGKEDSLPTLQGVCFLHRTKTQQSGHELWKILHIVSLVKRLSLRVGRVREGERKGG